MKLGEAPQTYDLFVKEQFLDLSPADLSTYLRERRLADLEEVARSVELFLMASKRQLSDRGLVGDKTVDVLRDTGCEGVLVRRRLADDDQLTAKCCLIVRIDNTLLLAENVRIQVKTPYLYGEVEALCIPKAICDLVVGNVMVLGTQMTLI
ncbi:hypothetical protein RRG08_049674 [Elysia crispata]|uniref:Uncharacterized protein n=1 Tax=Elysia crispata TaxID=231223 RepID=A0AAE0Y6K7_9GAST|nr:hypothetical protein RRG08_049674 [Elysia crispata]